MTIIDEIIHPLGNPMKEALPTERDLIALRNILNLARERVWMAQGKDISDEFDTELVGGELVLADMSIEACTAVIERLERYYETE